MSLLQHITKQSLRFKMVGLGLVSIVVTAATMILVGAWQTAQFTAVTENQVDTLIEQDLTYVAQGVYSLIKAQDESVRQTVGYNLNVAKEILAQNGVVTLSSERTEWETVNQFTLAEGRQSLPKMKIGNVWIGQNQDAATVTPVVDEIVRLVGGTSTVFQRMNEGGDMLRVATTVLHTDGSRAIGTYIPAINPDGQPNAVVSALLAGETYHGSAYVVNAWYVTAYEPIFDDRGVVIGALYVGVKQENIAALREAILNTKVGDTGYVYILGGQGEDRGHYIVSRNGERDGENIWDSQDADGHYFIQDIVNQGINLRENEFATITYPWQNVGEASARVKTAVIAYYAPWDWVIGVGAYTDDYAYIYQPIKSGSRQMLLMFVISGLLVSVAASILNWTLGSRLTRPITNMVVAANQLAVGNTSHNIVHNSKDEIGVLAGAFQKMTHYQREMTTAAQQIAQGNLYVHISPKAETDELGHAFTQMVSVLRQVIGGVQGTASLLTQAGDNLSQVVEQTEESASQINDAIRQVAKGSEAQTHGLEEANRLIQAEVQAIEGIAGGAQLQASTVQMVRQLLDEQLSRSIHQVENSAQASQEVATQAGQAAMDGGKNVTATLTGMQAISRSTRLAVERMAEMGDRSREIGGIVESISGIAERTNLLALNAAIEAARAGAHGKGFAVVADEVRKLAGQAAHATQEISKLVNGVQMAAGQAISAMDQSNREVEQGMALAEHTQQGLNRIQNAVSQVEQQIVLLRATVTEMHESNEGLKEAMQQMSVIVEQNQAASQDLAQQSTHLQTSASEIAAISEENSAAAYEVSASIASVSTQVEESNRAAQNLNEISRQLLALVQGFVLDQSEQATKHTVEISNRAVLSLDGHRLHTPIEPEREPVAL